MITQVVLTVLSLFISNIAGVFMVQAENRHKPVVAGLFEGVYGLLLLVAAKFTVSTFDGHSATNDIIIAVAAFVGYFFGSYVGTKLGDKYLDDPEATRITVIEVELERHHTNKELTDN